MKTALWSGNAQRQAAINIWISVVVISVASYLMIMEWAYLGAAMALVVAEATFMALNFKDCRRKGFPMGRYLGRSLVAGASMIGAALAMQFLTDGRINNYHLAFLSGLVYLLVILLSGFITRSDRELFKNALTRHRQ
jgi:O-antigen/teichoic acid export membrane protein